MFEFKQTVRTGYPYKEDWKPLVGSQVPLISLEMLCCLLDLGSVGGVTWNGLLGPAGELDCREPGQLWKDGNAWMVRWVPTVK